MFWVNELKLRVKNSESSVHTNVVPLKPENPFNDVFSRKEPEDIQTAILRHSIEYKAEGKKESNNQYKVYKNSIQN